MAQDDIQSPKAIARFILREALFGSLATEGEGGYPYVSLVSVAAMADGGPMMLLSNLARHTHNIRKDPRVSLLLAEKPKTEDPMASTRLTVTGKVAELDKNTVKARFLVRHPEAAKYADFGDFGLWRLEIEHGHLVAAFGRISDLSASELLGGGSMSWPKG